MTGIGVEAVVGGVEVAPGDLIVGDVDGIVAIPRALAADVAAAVATKHRLEGNARDDLLAGLGIREVWEKYGVALSAPPDSTDRVEIAATTSRSRVPHESRRLAQSDAHSARRRDTPGTLFRYVASYEDNDHHPMGKGSSG